MWHENPSGGASEQVAAGALPNPVRIYDYLLGGKDNLAVDRQAAEDMQREIPGVRESARANRRFLVRAVQLMAESGIRQFLDLGTGLPTSPNVHEIAQAVDPDVTVAYVDIDSTVMAFNRALRVEAPRVVAAQHDLRRPDEVLADPLVREVIDLEQPVGLLLVAVLHFVERHDAACLVASYLNRLAPGSMVAISAACAVDLTAPDVARIQAVYANTTPFVFHDPDEFTRLFDGLELIEPGIVEVSQWRGDGLSLNYAGMTFLAGVGRSGGP